MAELILKKGKEKSLLRRHPWVYDTAVERAVGNPKAGDTVKVVAKDGRFWLGQPIHRYRRCVRVAGLSVKMR